MSALRRTLALALALGLASCSSPNAPRGAHPQQAITFNISEDPHSLNPILAQSDDERQIAHLMFDLLLDVDPLGHIVPALATVVPSERNGGVSPDGRTITYHLRRDVRWQDGAPFTARDVQFTWRAIMDPSNDIQSTRGYDLIERISAADPYTLAIHLKAAWAPAVATLFTYGTSPMPILPAHLFTSTSSLRQSTFNIRPVGTGPYALVRWDRANRLIFAANQWYFRGRPKTPTLVAEEVPDINTSMTMLRTGQLDWTLLSPAQRLALGQPPEYHFVYAPFSGFGAIVFNCRRPPFDDVGMRRAIAMAIDRDRLSAGITRGQYPVANSDQPPFSWAYDSRVRLPAYNPAAADSLLDSLGWRRGADGMRRRGDEVLSLTFTTFPEGDTAVRTAEYVQQMLHERGIAVNVKKVTVAQFYLPKTAGGLLMSGSFDFAYMAWRTGEDPDDSDLMTCQGIANYAGYCSAALDALERQALTARRQAQRRSFYSRVQQLLARDLPYDFLYAPTYGFAAKRTLRDFRPTPFSPTWNSWAWRMRTGD